MLINRWIKRTVATRAAVATGTAKSGSAEGVATISAVAAEEPDATAKICGNAIR